MTSVWEQVIGQPAAVSMLRRTLEHPVHAYLFVGPSGSTKRIAARAFATVLLTGADDATSRDARLVMVGDHPDVREVEREGQAIDKAQADAIIHLSSLTPVESDRKAIILDEFHLLRPDAAARLLKTVEEPPPSTTFVILADHLTSDLVTIASRCVRVEFRSIDPEHVADRLVLEGTDPETAAEAAAASGGDLERARILASDPAVGVRRRAFAEAAYRLDGTGSVVMTLADELLGLVADAAAPLGERHEREIAEVEERIARMGERGSGRKRLEERHKRELRRHRTDELRHGLSVLASTYRDAVVTGRMRRPEAGERAVTRVHDALRALDRNPNESLLVQALLWSLPPLERPD